ncbi:MAG: hypothetical protein Q8R30_01945 [bacterium]|nr:hypothetical protein [bacterium]MDZ4286248.1 hypothetical protein [Candidatus Sungbacteria bacterium]
MFSPDDIRSMEHVRNLSNAEALCQIIQTEAFADESMEAHAITQEQAWDIYFGLMHECDERGLIEDRRRLHGKIDINVYNPFKSADNGIRVLAAIRMRMMQWQRAEIAKYN